MATDELIPIPTAASTVSKSFNERSDFGLCLWGRFAEKKAFEDFPFLVSIIVDVDRRLFTTTIARGGTRDAFPAIAARGTSLWFALG
jgi:hypothetical protein